MSAEFNPMPGRADIIIRNMAESGEAQRPGKKTSKSANESGNKPTFEGVTGMHGKIGEMTGGTFVLPGMEAGVKRAKGLRETLERFPIEEGQRSMEPAFKASITLSGGHEIPIYVYETVRKIKGEDGLEQEEREFVMSRLPATRFFNRATLTSILETAKATDTESHHAVFVKKAKIDRRFDNMDDEGKRAYLKDKFNLRVREESEEAMGMMPPPVYPEEVPIPEEPIERRELYDYDTRVRLVLAKLINFTRQGMENGTDFRNDNYYIALRGELQSYLQRFNLSVHEGHFKDVSDFAEIIGELEYLAKNSAGYSELDPIQEQTVLDDVISSETRADLRRARVEMDRRYSEIFRKMNSKSRELIFKNWSLDLEPQIQGVKSGWNRPSNVWEAYFGGRIYEQSRDADGNIVESWRYYADPRGPSVMSKVSRDVEEAQGGREMIGLTEWRLLKELKGANEQVLADLLKKPPAQWQEIPERVANIYREIERAELTVETLQGYIGDAIHMIKSIPGETEEGLEMINFHSKELEAFRAFHTLRITQERTGMDPGKAEDIYKSQFTDETWKYFLGRYAKDNRRRNFLSEDNVNINLSNPHWKIYMGRAQREKGDMVLVEYMTIVDIKNRINGDDDSRLRVIEKFVNRPKDLSARGGRLSLNGRAERMEDLRVQLLSEGAISDVKVLMAKLEGLKIRHIVGPLSPADFRRLERALEEDNKGGLFTSTNWDKARIEHFRFKTDEQIDAEIRQVISRHGSFDNENLLDDIGESWQKEALRGAYRVASIWGNASKTKDVTDQWYRKRTILGADGDDEYGRSLVTIRRREQKEALKAALRTTGLKIEGDNRDSEAILNELEENGYLEGLDSTMYQMFWMYAMPDFDMIRIYGKHFKTGKVSKYPQAITFNQASKNINGRMIHHMMDFMVDEQRGRSYEEDEVNGIARGFLPGFYDNMLPQNRTMVRFHRNFMTNEQEQEVEKRAIDLMKEYRLLPGLGWEERLNTEARSSTITEFRRDPYFDGILGWARSAVIAEMIDSGDFSQMDFTQKNIAEVMGSKISQYVLIDLSDDQRATAHYYGRQNFQDWMKNPSLENFLRVNNGADIFYSGRNVRIWAWMMIATNIQWEIMHHHYKRLKLGSENLSASIGESMVENLVASGAMGKDQGELIKSDHFGMKPEFLRGVPGAQILGTKPFRYARQIEEFVRSGLWETFKPWSFYYPKELWDLIKRMFFYLFRDFLGK